MDPNNLSANTPQTNPQPNSSPENSLTPNPTDTTRVANQHYNTLAVVGFILTFIMPIIGFILSIVALRQIKQTGEKGLGLAKAAIVIFMIGVAIVIVGIMVVLFSTSSSKVPGTSIQGSNKQAIVRDSERKNDINYLHSLLEQYQSEHGVYPTQEAFASQEWAQKYTNNLKSLQDAFEAPEINERYSYDVTSATCNTSGCDSYMLSAQLEDADAHLYSKTNLR